MKTLLTVTILVGGSLSLAQVPVAKQTYFGKNPSFQQRDFLEQRNALEKRNIMDFGEPNNNEDKRSSIEVRRNLMDASKVNRGTEGVGGGNGVQASDGKITPLDVVFAQENSVIDVKKGYSVGYGYFQEQLKKISKALPSFANDIEARFAHLTWIASGLELRSSEGCLNNMGIFQIRVGDKQVVLACQNSEGEVSLNVRAIKKLKDPRYLGVVFLHEAFVNSMLREYRSDEYPGAEFQMISKVVPYIISNKTLDPKKLYEYAQVVRYVRDQNYFNNYALEAFEDRRLTYQRDESEAESLLNWRSKLAPKIEKYIQHGKGLDCYGNNLTAYIESYGELVQAYHNVIDANEAFIKSSSNVERAAEVVAQHTIITNELINLQASHPKKLKSIETNCR